MISKGFIFTDEQTDQAILIREICGLQFVDLRREDEVALGQAIDLVRPDRDLRLSPPKTNIRVMSLLFREVPNTTHKCLRFPEV